MQSPSEQPLPTADTGTSLSSCISASSPSSQLRFPTPSTEPRIPDWLENTAAATMSTTGDAAGYDHLSDSTYEFIDTDSESRDDNTTESVGSADADRPEDDIASLADTEHSEEEDSEPVPAFPALERSTTTNAFSTPTLGRSTAVFFEDNDKHLPKAIEFEEPYSGLGAENISVKHTIADYSEEETAAIVQSTKMLCPPSRLVATIRQTMTKQGLSTREPLRILYTGSHSAKQDIIHKIASSVTASVESGKRTQHHSTSQLYNVVPVSAFGSERTPEIELMHSSGYQIKVEDCAFAQNLKFEDEPDKPDVIKLTLDDSISYHSVPEDDHFILEPLWELPHVAIFYCSESDDVETRRTRTIARQFMSRHNVPSIVISHKQMPEKGSLMMLDQHAIHMCLESRSPNGPIIHQRLPIDLTSFLNIDARQMNRNLAYVTGLHEAIDGPTAQSSGKSISSWQGRLFGPKGNTHKHARSRDTPEWRTLLPAGFLLLSVIAMVFTGVPSYRFASHEASSDNNKGTSTISTSAASVVPQTAASRITAAPAPAMVSTSTHTVTVTQSPGPNSLAVLPNMDLVSDYVNQVLHKASDKLICSAEILGDREVLIRIPSTTMLSWLNKEAMSVNISRGNFTITTERAYTSDDGLVLLLPKKEAFGVLNISVVTTKKPRINETYQVNFGLTPSQAFLEFIQKQVSLVRNTDVRTLAEKTYQQALNSSTYAAMEQVGKSSLEVANTKALELAASAKELSLEAAKHGAILSHEVGVQLSEKLAKPVGASVLKAQVRAKIHWLQLLGKEQEAKDYERRAREAGFAASKENLRKSRLQKKAEPKMKAKACAQKQARKEAQQAKKETKKASRKL